MLLAASMVGVAMVYRQELIKTVSLGKIKSDINSKCAQAC